MAYVTNDGTLVIKKSVITEQGEIFGILNGILPCAYSHFNKPQEPPYLVYIGGGQDNFDADGTHYYNVNRYQIEYYFKTKNEAEEVRIENALLGAGLLYEKSEDVFIEDEGVFVIYYSV